MSGIALGVGYAGLPDRFFARIAPTIVARPRLIELNRPLAAELGFSLEDEDEHRLAEFFSGNRLPPGAVPVATAYAGHQFGYFVPQLGDGRAILLGEVRDVHGRLREIQLKGSGPTPYSRRGDGRAALGPVLREYLVSEAMAAFGIPTTRSLAAVTTGEPVYREQALPGAVLTRVAASHVRVGTFQYFAARGDVEATRRLADYVIDRHYPELARGDPGFAREDGAPAVPGRYLALLAAVAERQAALIAEWMQIGFIHGVMNTDNMAVSGETIDFGPCAFLDAYDPDAVFSSIDAQGRYAYSNQANAAAWNLARFAETLLPLIDPEGERAVALATAALGAFPARYTEHWQRAMRAKLGLGESEDGDAELIAELLTAMHQSSADFTLTFRALAGSAEGHADAVVSDAIGAWIPKWRARLTREPGSAQARALAMRRVNPAFIPRNHRIEQVIIAAVEREDFAPFRELAAVLRKPFEEHADLAHLALPPLPEERVLRTFCGT
jgi:uncharacterized protein YdiU (UPF0061 family)